MKFNKGILPAGKILWAIAIAVGTTWVTDYVSRPGRSAVAPADLDLTSPTDAASLPKLPVFLHPYCCPCSRANLTELARLNAYNPPNRANGLTDL